MNPAPMKMHYQPRLELGEIVATEEDVSAVTVIDVVTSLEVSFRDVTSPLAA